MSDDRRPFIAIKGALAAYRDAKTGNVIDCLTAGDSHIVFEADEYGGLPDGPLVCLRCGAKRP